MVSHRQRILWCLHLFDTILKEKKSFSDVERCYHRVCNPPSRRGGADDSSFLGELVIVRDKCHSPRALSRRSRILDRKNHKLALATCKHRKGTR